MRCFTCGCNDYVIILMSTNSKLLVSNGVLWAESTLIAMIPPAGLEQLCTFNNGDVGFTPDTMATLPYGQYYY